MPTEHVLIMGKVQGVFFRASAKQFALQLGLTGWVKNTGNGSVESLVSGELHNIEKFIAWCQKGPSGARVDSIQVKSQADIAFEGFSIIH